MKYYFKTLNYLGCKLRLLDFIEENVKRLTPPGGQVCDLFAGSGTVAGRLAGSFNVTACDIQAYSKVICNAVLNGCEFPPEMLSSFCKRLLADTRSPLAESFQPLILMEQRAIAEADPLLLPCFVEHGSLEIFRNEPSDSPISDTIAAVAESLAHRQLDNSRSTISRYYGGVYFSYKQAVDIDNIIDAISDIIPGDCRDLFTAALLSTASDIVGTVGKHFAQPVKARDSRGNVKSVLFSKARKDKTIEVIPLYLDWLDRYLALPRRKANHTVMQADYASCLANLPETVTTIYADPPYTRDHYSRFYHVLETIALHDSPALSSVTIHGTSHLSNGIYRVDRHQSPFCIKSQAPDAFDTMFRLAAENGRNILLSYSPFDDSRKTHPRVATIGTIMDIAGKYYSDIATVSAGKFAHSKLNSSPNLLEASDEAELLIICTAH